MDVVDEAVAARRAPREQRVCVYEALSHIQIDSFIFRVDRIVETLMTRERSKKRRWNEVERMKLPREAENNVNYYNAYITVSVIFVWIWKFFNLICKDIFMGRSYVFSPLFYV